MPRQPRLDVPGLLHHVMARGIERREIFADDSDREAFVRKLGEVVSAAGAKVYAWCLLSNHFHLVVKSGERSLAWMMRRLMTAHAVRYNLRHKRCGHLFQNRYKSTVVEEERYLLELVRYVALNPVREGLLGSPEDLDSYAWSGHAALVGKRSVPWQEVDEVLARFAPAKSEAVARYREFVVAGWNEGGRQEVPVGGGARSARGRDVVVRRGPQEREAVDERILGSGAFVEMVRRSAEPQIAATPSRGWEEILRETAERAGLDEARILGGSRERRVSRARGEFFRQSRDEAGLSVTQLANLCRMNPSSVSRGIERAIRSESGSTERPGR